MTNTENQRKFHWGFVAEDTKILMADGSEREIRWVRCGDRISGENGSAMVVDVMTGYETMLLSIETQDGKKIRTTATYPLVAENRGLVMAEELTPEDRLLTIFDGYTEIKTICEEKYEGYVYCLWVSQNCNVVCNRLITGSCN
ncbi:MAG: Hint domain-containing protein [Agathobacter sp.]